MSTKTYAIPQGKFVFKAKANEAGEKALYLQYTINSVPVFRTTGVFVKEGDFDSKRQRIKSGASATRTNNELQAKKRKVDTQIADFLHDGGTLTKEIIKQMLEGSYASAYSAKKIDLVKYALDYNERRYLAQEITEKTRYNHEKILKAFASYLRNELGTPSISLAQVTVELLDKFKIYCVDKLGNKTQSVNKKLDPISNAISYAAKNGLVPMSLVTMIQESRFQEKAARYDADADDDVKYLSLEQMGSLIKLYSTVKYERTRDFLDMFLFSFHACGLRASDIITLEWQHIDLKGKSLKKVLVKSKRNNTIPLSDPALKILERWSGKHERFVFGLLPDDFDTDKDKELTKAINNKNRTIRQSLNEIGRKLKLSFNLGMHVARHTFAIMALNDREVDLYTISRLMGHSSVTVTEAVYAKHLKPKLEKELRERLTFNSFQPTT